MLASAMSSSRSGARLHHSESRWEQIERVVAEHQAVRRERRAASTPSGMVVSTPASGSSKSVPKAHCEASPPSSPS